MAAARTHYRRLQSDPVYRQAFEEATEEVGQMLEDLAVDRAYDGDNHVLLALLKRFRPELYRERISTDTTITINLVERMTAANERLLTLRRSNAGQDGTEANGLLHHGGRGAAKPRSGV